MKKSSTVGGIPVLMICTLIFMGGYFVGWFLPDLIAPKSDFASNRSFLILIVVLLWLIVSGAFSYRLRQAFAQKKSIGHDLKDET